MIDGTNLPYVDTHVPIEKTKQEISDLLKKFGACGIQWTWIKNVEILRFMHEFEFKGVKRSVTYEINIPEMGIRQWRGYDRMLARNDRQAYRMVLYLIKAKLTAIESGIETFENEFLSKILYSLPNGRSAKVGDIILQQISETKQINLLE